MKVAGETPRTPTGAWAGCPITRWSISGGFAVVDLASAWSCAMSLVMQLNQRAEVTDRATIVSQILRLNATVSERFLQRFEEPALRSYLQKLQASQQPRGRTAVWVRSELSPGISGLQSAW
jgi:hypothetical protein